MNLQTENSNYTCTSPVWEIHHKPLLGDLLHWYQLNARCKDDPENEELRKLKETQENWLQSDMLPFQEMLENGLEVHESEKTEMIHYKK